MPAPPSNGGDDEFSLILQPPHGSNDSHGDTSSLLLMIPEPIMNPARSDYGRHHPGRTVHHADIDDSDDDDIVEQAVRQAPPWIGHGTGGAVRAAFATRPCACIAVTAANLTLALLLLSDGQAGSSEVVPLENPVMVTHSSLGSASRVGSQLDPRLTGGPVVHHQETTAQALAPRPLPGPQPPPSPAIPPAVPPPIPPLPPPSPRHPPPGAAVADRLNERFRVARPSNDLRNIGVLLRQFDSTEHPEKPWLPCPEFCRGDRQVCECAFLRDRLSSSVVFADMPHEGSIPLYEGKRGGVVYNPDPSFTRIFCAYPSDAGSRARVCDPPGPSESCTPGCTDSWHPWCDGNQHDVWCSGNPWSPNMLPTLLEGFMGRQASTYNEFVLDAAYSVHNLPASVEAFFFPMSDRCVGDGHMRLEDLRDGGTTPCVADVVRSHSRFLLEYGLSADEVPLLAMKLDDWDAPFVPAGSAL